MHTNINEETLKYGAISTCVAVPWTQIRFYAV